MDLITKPVHQFPAVAGGITATSKIPLAQRSNGEDPDDLHCTPEDIVNYLKSRGVIIVQGTFNSDAEAAVGNVAIGEYYRCGPTHEEGMPEGVIKTRIV